MLKSAIVLIVSAVVFVSCGTDKKQSALEKNISEYLTNYDRLSIDKYKPVQFRQKRKVEDSLNIKECYSNLLLKKNPSLSYSDIEQIHFSEIKSTFYVVDHDFRYDGVLKSASVFVDSADNVIYVQMF